MSAALGGSRQPQTTVHSCLEVPTIPGWWASGFQPAHLRQVYVWLDFLHDGRFKGVFMGQKGCLHGSSGGYHGAGLVHGGCGRQGFLGVGALHPLNLAAGSLPAKQHTPCSGDPVNWWAVQ